MRRRLTRPRPDPRRRASRVSRQPQNATADVHERAAAAYPGQAANSRLRTMGGDTRREPTRSAINDSRGVTSHHHNKHSDYQPSHDYHHQDIIIKTGNPA